MKFTTAFNSLNLRKNKNSETYTAYNGRNTIAKQLFFYGGVWKIIFNNFSVDYYQNDAGQVIYILTENSSDLKKGLYFETPEQELLFLEQFENCINTAGKMQELIRVIKEI